MNDVLDTKWNQAIRIEMRVAEICRQQELHGWLFDVDKAFSHRDTLVSSRRAIDDIVAPLLPWFPESFSTPFVSAPFTQKGGLATRVVNYMGEQAECVAGPFNKVGWHRMNLGSDKQVKDYLLTIGWEPDEYNFNKETGERTSPKLTEDSLSKIDHPLGKHISQRMVIDHRLGLLDGLLRVVRSDDRIPSEMNTMGTPTGRATHRKIVNIPKAKETVFFGRELRELFIVPPGYKLVGCDAAGLEMRMLAHYMNSHQFTEELLQGDVHTENWNACKDLVATRDIQKNILYATLYGAGDEKLGRTAGYSGTKKYLNSIGQEIRARLMKRLPAFEKLTRATQFQAKRGFLQGLDGRKVYVRSEHSALNSLLQSGGAIVMKSALCWQDMWVRKYKLDVHQVTWQHDETQNETAEKDVEVFAELSPKAIVKAGEDMKLNCPLAGSVAVGNNWRDTH